MAIYRKDGSVFKLDGPNPLLAEQDQWDNFVVHNKKGLGKKIIISNKGIIEEEKHKEVLGDGNIARLDDPVIEVPKKEVFSYESSNIPRTTTTTPVPKVGKKPISCRANIVPTRYKNIIDDLYGDVITRVLYLDPIETDIYPIGYSGTEAKFFCLFDLEKESIIYPQNNEKRWWKVINTEKYSDGYMINCIMSQKTPSFT